MAGDKLTTAALRGEGMADDLYAEVYDLLRVTPST